MREAGMRPSGTGSQFRDNFRFSESKCRKICDSCEVSTKALNQAVKRNAGRFPPGFMFRLTKDELADLRSQNVASNTEAGSDPPVLRSQIVTSKRGSLCYCPYAFTEHGVVMLASLLKSATATEVSVRIVDAFVAMRKFILANAQVFQRLENVEQRHRLVRLGRNRAERDPAPEGRVTIAPRAWRRIRCSRACSCRRSLRRNWSAARKPARCPRSGGQCRRSPSSTRLEEVESRRSACPSIG